MAIKVPVGIVWFWFSPFVGIVKDKELSVGVTYNIN